MIIAKICVYKKIPLLMWCQRCYDGGMPLKVGAILTTFQLLGLCLQITYMENLSQSCCSKQSNESRGERENNIQKEERSGLTEMWGRGRGRNLKPCSKCETLEQKCGEEKNVEKENVGKGKERVLCEKFCNRVSEEQNVEKENVRKGRKFCNRVSERFHKGLG